MQSMGSQSVMVVHNTLRGYSMQHKLLASVRPSSVLHKQRCRVCNGVCTYVHIR